jgi:hypothetical protein
VETDTESGTLSYAGQHTVYDRLSGTITWLPRVGRVIKRGQALFRVDNKPVILLYGSTPAYRDLDSSDSSGPDIRELNANLVVLGYNPDGIVVDDTWQSATTAGVDALQKALGETQTGELSLGRVVFLPDKQFINSLDGTVGSGGGGSGSSSSNAGYVPADPASPEFVSYHPSSTGTVTHRATTTPTTTATTSTTSTSTTSTTTPARTPPRHKASHNHGGGGGTSIASLEALIARLERQVAALSAHSGSGSLGGSSSGSSGGSSSGSASGSGNSGTSSNSGSSGGSGGSGSSGGSGGSPVAILQTSSTRLVATVNLAASSQSEAVVGSHVTVEMPNGSTVGGTITAVSPVASSSSSSGSGSGSSSSGSGSSGSGSGGSGTGGSGSSATVPVTITLDKQVQGGGLDQAAVSVNFAKARAPNVLSVPVTALLATTGGGYSVQQATAPHRLIPVTTGLFAAGYVQISGPGVYPGLVVTNSQG